MMIRLKVNEKNCVIIRRMYKRFKRTLENLEAYEKIYENKLRNARTAQGKAHWESKLRKVKKAKVIMKEKVRVHRESVETCKRYGY